MKRKPEPAPSETPLKRSRRTETPIQGRFRDDELMNSPAISRKLFSPAKVTSLGPTPQKDGRVLGLFDLLVERELGTPSRKDSNRPVARHDTNVTPSKLAHSDGDSRLVRAPMSASRRHDVNATMTPLKKQKTPTSVSKLQYDTPAFLKRHTENSAFDMAAPLKLPRKPLVRGLSEIVASLKRVEEEALDDDLDALREAENEQDGRDAVRLPSPTPASTDDQPGRRLLSGLDDEGIYNSPAEDETSRNEPSSTAYKKKAPKRTTRRVNIKPTWIKRPLTVAESDEDDASVTTAEATGPSLHAAEGQELAGEDQAPDESAASKAKAKPLEGGPVKKAARKVNELAHANFQRLKLRNSEAKGGPGHSSRFRRRR